jgi:long-chain fatty acid transport protein
MSIAKYLNKPQIRCGVGGILEEHNVKNTVYFVATATAVVAVTLMAGTPAWALGFRNPDQDARATGQGEAFVAQADDASAIYYNPAGLTQVRGTQVTSGSYLDFPNIHFYPTGGGDFHPEDKVVLLPHFYAASDFGLERWRFGLGLNVPFGNSIDWGKSGPLQYLTTSSQLAVYNIEPTVAYQFNEHLSLGAGLNIYQANTSVERNLPVDLGGGHFRFHGNGDAFGATAGVLWKINSQHSIGLVYRSPFEITFNGWATLQGNAMSGADANSRAGASIQFPQSVAAGYAYRPLPKLKLEVDVDWTDWATLDNVYLRSSNPLFNAGSNPSQSTIRFNWMDSFYYEFGAQYELSDHWVVRGGYIFSENTVPNSSFSPTLPDSNRHVFSIGLGYVRPPHLNMDIVYQYSLSEDRTVNGSLNSPAVDGTWKSDGHAVMVTSTLKF